MRKPSVDRADGPINPFRWRKMFPATQDEVLSGSGHAHFRNREHTIVEDRKYRLVIL
jgi:hypothetical protein